MKTIAIEVYKFNELDEKAKQKAISELYDINVFYDWWDFTYEDAAAVGLEITSFDTGSRNDITGNLNWAIRDSIEAIHKNHGEDCETYKLASKYKERLTVIEVKNELTKDSDTYEEELETLRDDYHKSLLNCYWQMLCDEYNYLTNEEAIIETINANEYYFYKDGKQY